MDTNARLEILATTVAADLTDGLTVGLGSGSTAEAVVRAVGARVSEGLRVTGVPTSARTADLARSLGIHLVPLDEVDRIDLGIDGADEIDPSLELVKGAGGALLYEKLVALACRDYLVVAASEKLVDRLGTRMPLPVDVVPVGVHLTLARLRDAGCRPTIRQRDGAPFVTDGGHWVADCEVDPIPDAVEFAARLKAITGVVDTGLFVGIARRAAVVHADGRVERLARPA